MEPFEKLAIQSLFEKKLITDTIQVKAYRSLEIFTKCRVEIFAVPIRFSLYDGYGFIIYQNVDSIGHTILSLILVVTVVCYYFSFKTVLDFKTRNTI
jgi:hypothetical protein